MGNTHNFDARIATMDYNDIPLFVRVVETGSFTRAAEALGREKSSVSRSIARLEDDLGVRLLQRTTRRLSLTDVGQAFYERVRGAVTGVEEAATAAQDLGTEPRGVVRVNGPPDIDSLGLPEMLAEFNSMYPKIHVELSVSPRAVDIVGEGYDLAIRGGKLVDSSLVARRVGSTDFAIFGSPAYLDRNGRPRKLADVARHPCVMLRGHAGRATWTLTGPNGDESVEVSGPISVDHLAFAARAVAAGVGLGLLPIALVSAFARIGPLEPVLRDYRLGGGALFVVLPTAAFVPARVGLLRDFLVARLSDELDRANATCRAHAAAAKRRPTKRKP
jgi:DNA-binding transcriptional LysR family regulator